MPNTPILVYRNIFLQLMTSDLNEKGQPFGQPLINAEKVSHVFSCPRSRKQHKPIIIALSLFCNIIRDAYG